MIVNCHDSGDSVSQSITETVNGSHTFIVRGFSLAKSMAADEFLSSDKFTVGGYDWAIFFYPNAKYFYLRDSVSLYVVLASEGIDVRAVFSLALLDQSGKEKPKHFEPMWENGPHTFKHNGGMVGYKHFCRKSDLEASHYLKDDCLFIRCNLGVVRNRIEPDEDKQQYKIPVLPSDMGQSMKSLVDSGTGWDVMLQVGNQTFKAHKLILAARSPMFRVKFVGDNNVEVLDKVILEDIEPSVFKAMLEFIYSDEFPDLQGEFGVQDLLAAADRFGVGRLKQLCEAKLSEGITVDSVITTLCLADQYRCSQLKSMCLKSALSNFEMVMQSKGFKYLEENERYQPLLAELLEMGEKFGLNLTKKRNARSSIVIDIELVQAPELVRAAEVEAAMESLNAPNRTPQGAATSESVNPNLRRSRRLQGAAPEFVNSNIRRSTRRQWAATPESVNSNVRRSRRLQGAALEFVNSNSRRSTRRQGAATPESVNSNLRCSRRLQGAATPEYVNSNLRRSRRLQGAAPEFVNSNIRHSTGSSTGICESQSQA